MKNVNNHSLALFDTALRELRNSLLTMSSIAQRNLESAGRGLLDRNSTLCSLVIGEDDEVDELERLIDREAMEILIRYSPLAQDLRVVLASMRIASNLERVSDQAVTVARRARKMNKQPEAALCKTIEPVLQLSKELIRDCMKAFAEGNVPLALSVIARDRELDRRHRTLTKEFTRAMEVHPVDIRTHLHLTFIVRALERVGDHAVNIAEDVVFIEQGEDIRHVHETGEAKRRTQVTAAPLN
ncbi:MAG: phosphate transport system protein [Verrucomicrobia bacterium]|nr:MAG: phosphate transport system protein [Verrucomicrobiota bacterium]